MATNLPIHHDNIDVDKFQSDSINLYLHNHRWWVFAHHTIESFMILLLSWSTQGHHMEANPDRRFQRPKLAAFEIENCLYKRICSHLFVALSQLN